MQTIKIVPDGVDATARSLQAGATQVNEAGTSARTALGSTRGLPAAFAQRADALAGVMSSKCLRASDAIAIAGIELSRRAEVARIVDSNRIVGYTLGSTRAVGAGQSLRLWTQATEDRANAKPGAYFKEIAAALAKPSSGPSTLTQAPAAIVQRGPDVKPTALVAANLNERLRTGSTVTIAEAARIADTSGTGIAIAISQNGLLTISRDA